MPDWVFITLGWLLTAVALALLGWSLVGDRPRGRKRCPKCWYDLSGQVAQQPAPPWTCPECGRSITTARAVNRARRRRWLIALLALVALTGLYLSPRISAIRARGWWAAAPRPVLLAMMLRHPNVYSTAKRSTSNYTPWYREIVYRYHIEPVGWWPGESMLARAIVREAFAPPQGWPEELLKLAAETLVLTSDAPLEGLDPVAKAYVAIYGMNLRYSMCESYEDRGMSSARGGEGSRTVWRASVFFTRIERTGKWLFFDFYAEPRSYTEDRTRFVAWGAKRAFNLKIGRGQERQSTDPSSAISMFGFTFYTIGMFFDSVALQATAPDAIVLAEETFDGHPCIRVQLKAADGSWALIDTESLVLRKLYLPYMVTVFRPVLNAPRSPQLTDYDQATGEPRPIGDGSALTTELRDLLDSPPSDPEPQ